MRMREIETAERFGILERCRAFEKDLLGIEDIVPDKSDDGVPFDLSGLYDDIFQVIIVPKYAIRPDRNDYWEARKRLKRRVIALAEKYDLRRTGDPIEDHGEHFYFVFRCGRTWTAPGGEAQRREMPACAALPGTRPMA